MAGRRDKAPRIPHQSCGDRQLRKWPQEGTRRRRAAGAGCGTTNTPAHTAVPQLPDGPVELLPGIQTTSWDAAAWFSGEASSPDPDRDPWPTSKEFELVRAVRDRRSQLLATAQFFEFADRLARTARDRKRPITPRDPEVRAFTEQLQTLKQEITRLDEVIRENGGVIDDK